MLKLIVITICSLNWEEKILKSHKRSESEMFDLVIRNASIVLKDKVLEGSAICIEFYPSSL